MYRFELNFLLWLAILTIVCPRIGVALIVHTLQNQCSQAGYQVACIEITCGKLSCGDYNILMKKYDVTGSVSIAYGSVCDRDKVWIDGECKQSPPDMHFEYVGDTTVSMCVNRAGSSCQDNVAVSNDPRPGRLVKTVDTQCKELGYSVACEYQNEEDWAEFGCQQLHCGVEVEPGVYYQVYDWKKPDEGSQCGRNRACIDGRCVRMNSALPIIYEGDNSLVQCSSEVQFGVINDQRQREVCDDRNILPPPTAMVKTVNEKCLLLNYDVACKSKHLIGDAACNAIRCGTAIGPHLYSFNEIPKIPMDGTFCGFSRICKRGKCVRLLPTEKYMYEGFLQFAECKDISKPPAQTQYVLPTAVTLNSQCKFLKYEVACLPPRPDMDICEKLLCGVRLENDCYIMTVLDFPPNEGSLCAPGRVCKNKKCVPILPSEVYIIEGDETIVPCL